MSIWKKVVLLCFLCVIAIFAIKVHHVRVEQGKYQMTRIDEANRYLQEGNHLLKDGNIDGAIKNYRMALEVQPNWDIALDNIKAADRLIKEYREILDMAHTNQVIYEENHIRYLLIKKGESVELKRFDGSDTENL